MIRVFIYHTQPNRLRFLQRAVTAYFQDQKHTYRLTVCSKYDDAMRYLNDEGKDDDAFFFDFTDFSAGTRLANYLRKQSSHGLWIYMDGSEENLYKAMLLTLCLYSR